MFLDGFDLDSVTADGFVEQSGTGLALREPAERQHRVPLLGVGLDPVNVGSYVRVGGRLTGGSFEATSLEPLPAESAPSPLADLEGVLEALRTRLPEASLARSDPGQNVLLGEQLNAMARSGAIRARHRITLYPQRSAMIVITTDPDRVGAALADVADEPNLIVWRAQWSDQEFESAWEASAAVDEDNVISSGSGLGALGDRTVILRTFVPDVALSARAAQLPPGLLLCSSWFAESGR